MGRDSANAGSATGNLGAELVPAVTFNENTFSRGAAQAALSAGRSVHLDEGTYDLGSGSVGLELTQTNTDLLGFGNVLLQYSGTGTAVKLNGGSGLLSGVRVDGGGSGYGIEVDGSAIRLRDFEIRDFATGLYLTNAEIWKCTNGFIQTCTVGIQANAANAQNQVVFEDLKFRTNSQAHMYIRKAKSWHMINCDFESGGGYAVDIASSGGGTIQNVVFSRCWFEKNNEDYEAADDRAEIRAVSALGLTVRSLRFENCYWGLVNGVSGSANKSTEYIRLGSDAGGDADEDNTTIVGGHPNPLTPDTEQQVAA